VYAILIHSGCLEYPGIFGGGVDLIIEAPSQKTEKGVVVYSENEDSLHVMQRLQAHWESAQLFPCGLFRFDMTGEEVVALLEETIGNIEIFECQCRLPNQRKTAICEG